MLGDVIQHFEVWLRTIRLFRRTWVVFVYTSNTASLQALPQETGLDFRKHYAKALYKFLSGRQLRGKWGGSNQGMLETDRGLCRVESPESEFRSDKRELLMRLISFHLSTWRFLGSTKTFSMTPGSARRYAAPTPKRGLGMSMGFNQATMYFLATAKKHFQNLHFSGCIPQAFF